jgi:hypothetical protein
MSTARIRVTNNMAMHIVYLMLNLAKYSQPHMQFLMSMPFHAHSNGYCRKIDSYTDAGEVGDSDGVGLEEAQFDKENAEDHVDDKEQE